MNYFAFAEPANVATQYLQENGYLPNSETDSDSSGPYPEFVAILIYGSRVYGTDTPDSDFDFLVVVDSNSLAREIKEEIGIHHLKDSNIEVSLVSTKLFDSMFEKCSVRAIESIFTPNEYILMGSDWIMKMRHKFQNSLDTDRSNVLNRVRSAFSSVSSNSEVKARKKVQDREYMVGIKSLFHSIRLLMFGIQVGLQGEIYDFTVGMDCWNDITKTLIPKIEDESIKQSDCKAFYKKWAKTPYGDQGEKPIHLLSRFKVALPKI